MSGQPLYRSGMSIELNGASGEAEEKVRPASISSPSSSSSSSSSLSWLRKQNNTYGISSESETSLEYPETPVTEELKECTPKSPKIQTSEEIDRSSVSGSLSLDSSINSGSSAFAIQRRSGYYGRRTKEERAQLRADKIAAGVANHSLPLPLVASSVEAPQATVAVVSSYLDKVIQETVDTEKIYVKDLKDILRGYLLPIAGAKDMQIPREDMHALFGNIKAIYKFNRRFVERLKKSNLDPVLVGKCFVDESDGFKVYADYCTNYPRSLETLSRYSLDPRFSFLLKRLQEGLNHPLPLQTYLFKPIQRILKYHLLLKNIVAHHNESLPGHDILVQAHASMMDVATHLNEMKRNQERRTEIQRLLLGSNGMDLSSFGDLILEDKFNSGLRDVQWAFLFRKGLLIAKKRRDDQLQLKTTIKCSNLMLVESISREPLSFHVLPFDSPKTQYTLQARNMDQKQRWCREIKTLMLDSYNVAIPDKARQLLMRTGNSPQEQDRHFEIPKRHVAPEYLERRRQRRQSISSISGNNGNLTDSKILRNLDVTGRSSENLLVVRSEDARSRGSRSRPLRVDSVLRHPGERRSQSLDSLRNVEQDSEPISPMVKSEHKTRVERGDERGSRSEEQTKRKRSEEKRNRDIIANPKEEGDIRKFRSGSREEKQNRQDLQKEKENVLESEKRLETEPLRLEENWYSNEYKEDLAKRLVYEDRKGKEKINMKDCEDVQSSQRISVNVCKDEKKIEKTKAKKNEDEQKGERLSMNVCEDEEKYEEIRVKIHEDQPRSERVSVNVHEDVKINEKIKERTSMKRHGVEPRSERISVNVCEDEKKYEEIDMKIQEGQPRCERISVNVYEDEKKKKRTSLREYADEPRGERITVNVCEDEKKYELENIAAECREGSGEELTVPAGDEVDTGASDRLKVSRSAALRANSFRKAVDLNRVDSKVVKRSKVQVRRKRSEEEESDEEEDSSESDDGAVLSHYRPSLLPIDDQNSSLLSDDSVENPEQESVLRFGQPAPYIAEKWSAICSAFGLQGEENRGGRDNSRHSGVSFLSTTLDSLPGEELLVDVTLESSVVTEEFFNSDKPREMENGKTNDVVSSGIVDARLEVEDSSEGVESTQQVDVEFLKQMSSTPSNVKGSPDVDALRNVFQEIENFFPTRISQSNFSDESTNSSISDSIVAEHDEPFDAELPVLTVSRDARSPVSKPGRQSSIALRREGSARDALRGTSVRYSSSLPSLNGRRTSETCDSRAHGSVVRAVAESPALVHSRKLSSSDMTGYFTESKVPTAGDYHSMSGHLSSTVRLDSKGLNQSRRNSNAACAADSNVTAIEQFEDSFGIRRTSVLSGTRDLQSSTAAGTATNDAVVNDPLPARPQSVDKSRNRGKLLFEKVSSPNVPSVGDASQFRDGRTERRNDTRIETSDSSERSSKSKLYQRSSERDDRPAGLSPIRSPSGDERLFEEIPYREVARRFDRQHTYVYRLARAYSSRVKQIQKEAALYQNTLKSGAKRQLRKWSTVDESTSRHERKSSLSDVSRNDSSSAVPQNRKAENHLERSTPARSTFSASSSPFQSTRNSNSAVDSWRPISESRVNARSISRKLVKPLGRSFDGLPDFCFKRGNEESDSEDCFDEPQEVSIDTNLVKQRVRHFENHKESSC